MSNSACLGTMMSFELLNNWVWCIIYYVPKRRKINQIFKKMEKKWYYPSGFVSFKDRGHNMDIRGWTTAMFWLTCVLVDAVEIIPTSKAKGISKHRVQNIVSKSLHLQRRQSSFKRHIRNSSATRKKLKKRHNHETSFKRKSDIPHEVTLIQFPTGGYSNADSLQLQQGTNKHEKQRRNDILDHFSALKRHERWKMDSLEGSEDGLTKRSRNRVRPKSHRSGYQQIDLNLKQNTLKEVSNRTVSKEIKRQRISELFANNVNPFELGRKQITPVEEMRLSANPDSFFADPIAANSVRALNPSHYYAPTVHKFIPAEHRYPSPPIHRYLSSPVVFKDASNLLGDGGQDLAGGKGIVGQQRQFEGGAQPFLGGLPQHRQHVIVVKRPFQNPFPLPLPRPSHMVLVHQPLPLPPIQRLPVPLMVHGPRSPPLFIVHHREFSGRGEFEMIRWKARKAFFADPVEQTLKISVELSVQFAETSFDET